MATCKSCGAQVNDGEKTCAACGAAMEIPAAQAQAQAPFQPTKKSGVDVGKIVNRILDTPDTTASHDANDIKQNSILSLFSYLGILFLIPLFACKNSRFARFHVNQGIVLFALEFVVGLFLWAVSFVSILGSIPVLGIIASIFGVFLSIVGWVFEVFFFALAVLGIINAVQGKAKQLPFIGGIVILK